MQPSVTIVGPGRMGLALGYALVQAEAVRSLTVCGRRPEPPAHPLFTQGLARYVFGMEGPHSDSAAVFLAVPDAVVPEIAHTLAAQGPPPDGCVAFHLSGALPTDVLAPLHARGYAIGSFHPLQAVTHPVTGAERLPGSYVAVTGAPEAVAVARRLTAPLGCPLLTLPAAWKPLCHAATVMASNYLPPLLDIASRMMEQSGVAPEDALAALLTLVRGTLASIEEVGLEAAVTGPVVDGDLETVALHLRAMAPEDRRIYATFGREVARLAGPGLSDDARRELIDRFEKEVSE